MLHCVCTGMARAISFQGWFCILGLGVVERVQAVEPKVDVGVVLEIDGHVVVAVEHVAGGHVEVAVGIVGVKDRAGKGVVGLAPELLEGDVMENAHEETFDDKVLDDNVEILRQEVVEAESDVGEGTFVTPMDEMVK